MKTVIVDYGVGNLYSVQSALKRVGDPAKVSNNKEEILHADRLVLPGVGAFESGMKHLTEYGLVDAVKNYAGSGKPLLGICLGMQLLLSRSEENGLHSGLDLIRGRVIRLKPGDPGDHYKIPQIGWNSLKPSSSGPSWEGSVLEGLEKDPFMYFVHSYRVVPEDTRDALALTVYGSNEFCSVVRHKNITGCQFHPERSGEAGLKIYANFISGKV